MHLRRPSAGIFWRFAMNEFWNSAALVALGSVLGAWAFGVCCGCLGRWRWNRQWRAWRSGTSGILRWSAHVAVSRHDGRTSGGRSGRELEGGGAVKLILLPEPSIKVRELARVWGVTSCWLRKLIGRGELEAVRLGRDWVVPWRRQIDF